MGCEVYPLDTLKNYKYVVIFSEYKNKIMLSKHKNRSTWETQGGHIEPNETPIDAAKRELFEESGAIKYDIQPIFDYKAGDEHSYANGVVFFAKIKELSQMPQSEMELVKLFNLLPNNLTYPDITPILFKEA